MIGWILLSPLSLPLDTPPPFPAGTILPRYLHIPLAAHAAQPGQGDVEGTTLWTLARDAVEPRLSTHGAGQARFFFSARQLFSYFFFLPVFLPFFSYSTRLAWLGVKGGPVGGGPRFDFPIVRRPARLSISLHHFFSIYSPPFFFSILPRPTYLSLIETAGTSILTSYPGTALFFQSFSLSLSLTLPVPLSLCLSFLCRCFSASLFPWVGSSGRGCDGFTGHGRFADGHLEKKRGKEAKRRIKHMKKKNTPLPDPTPPSVLRTAHVPSAVPGPRTTLGGDGV